MRAGYLAVGVVGALVSTSAWAAADSHGGGRSSGHSSSGGSAVARGRSSASSSRSGHTSQYRSAGPRYSPNRGASPRYRAGGGYRGYRGGYSSYRYRPYYGYRSYYGPGLGLYVGSAYYDGYYDGGYYPEAYATAPYAAAPYAPGYVYGAPAEGDENDRAPYDDRDGRGPVDAPGSSRLRLDVHPADATIYVDDQFRGTAGNETVLSLTPGRHTIEIARPGFQSERRIVEAGNGDARPLSVTLQPARR